jgi:hypothetical protein
MWADWLCGVDARATTKPLILETSGGFRQPSDANQMVFGPISGNLFGNLLNRIRVYSADVVDGVPI